MKMNHFFRTPALSRSDTQKLLVKIQEVVPGVTALETELHYYVECDKPLVPEKGRMLAWFFAEQFEPEKFGKSSKLAKTGRIIEVGPRKVRIPPWSSTALLINRDSGIDCMVRIACARRYRLVGFNGSKDQQQRIVELLHDEMTEEVYDEPLLTFETGVKPPQAEIIKILEDGEEAIIAFAEKRNLKFDRGLRRYILREYRRVKRNPTDIELFLIGQLWSNHCRHRDMHAKFIIDGKLQRYSPFELVKQTCKGNLGPFRVVFSDNAAIMRPKRVVDLVPANSIGPAPYVRRVFRRGTMGKDETHNMPTMWDPYDGAGTGMAVVRDGLGAGRGGNPKYYINGVFVGNLFLPNMVLPWEKMHLPHPKGVATPSQIALEGTLGAENHANSIGIPIIGGVYYSFDMRVDGVHYAYTKPVLLAGCGGWVDALHFHKNEPQKGMLLVLMGGPAYWIGVAGGSGSSQDAGLQRLDLVRSSVQRPDPWTENKNWNLFRAAIERGRKNPFEVVGDLGAGGLDVAVPEAVYPAGAIMYLDEIPSGDPSMPEYVLTGNEAQERMLALVWPENYGYLEQMAARFRCQIKVIGEVTGDGKFTMVLRGGQKRVSMDMGFMLQDLPRLTVGDQTVIRRLLRPDLPEMSIRQYLSRTQCLAQVASKEWIVDKGDMTVTGDVNCCPVAGPCNLPLADCGVVVDSFYETTGQATGIGVQPGKMLVNLGAGIRVAFTEALLNLFAARVDPAQLGFSATWQWPFGQPGESAAFYRGVQAANRFCRKLRDILRIGVGKDSLSMTVVHENKEVTKAPGTVEFRAFTDCLDVTKTRTPDIKRPGESRLLLLDPSAGLRRLGGSALLQVFNQIGHKSPDVDYPHLLVGTLLALQELSERGLILSYHDRTGDGGLIQCLLEMAYGGNCGLVVDLPASEVPGVGVVEDLFAEEPGVVIEFLPEHQAEIRRVLRRHGVSSISSIIAKTIEGTDEEIVVAYGGQVVLRDRMIDLRQEWRELSFAHDAEQANPETVAAEQRNTYHLPRQHFHLTFQPKPTKRVYFRVKTKPRGVVFMEAGTNGHRELAGALYEAGIEPWCVFMTDWQARRFNLDPEMFRLFAIAGGWADMDVGGAGKGVAMRIRFNKWMRDQLLNFVQHQGTLGLGICNGFQAMTRLGILPWIGMNELDQPYLVRNLSGRFESRPIMVRIEKSPCIWTAGMEGSVFPAWQAHGEGYVKFRNPAILQQVLEQNLAPIRFADRLGRITEDYPFNPNGSPCGITSFCSPDGRFVGEFPHFERNFRRPGIRTLYYPPEMRNLPAAPALRFYQNAREWLDRN